MARKDNPGVQKYTVQESQNLGFGQAGSAYSEGTTIAGMPGGVVVVAITMLADTTFAKLTPENSNYLEVDSTGYNSEGDTLANDDVFPKGITIYGRWTEVDVSAGNIVAYFG
tara:strand:+ start:141 stop:476 length:336 start_codon:yes stop_codon:yes gene_type:complete